MRIRLETPSWFRRLISQAAQVTIVPILRFLEGLNLRETLIMGVTNQLRTTISVIENVVVNVVVLIWQVFANEVVGLVETLKMTIGNFLTSVISVVERGIFFATHSRVPPCDSVVLLARNHNQIQYDPTPLWDGNVNTALTLLYDSSDATKPFRIRFHWNNPQQITHVSIFVTDASSNARFILERWEGETTYTVLKTNLIYNQYGWLTHTIPDDYKNNVTNLCIRAVGGADNYITIAEVRFFTAYNFFWQFGSEWVGLREYVTALLDGKLVLFPQSILSVTEFVEAVLTYTGNLIPLSIQELLGTVESLWMTIKNFLTETVGVVENVVANLQSSGGGGGTLQWNYSVAYDQQGNQINLDLSPLQDSDTSTSVSIYYSPPAPSNPRRFIVGWYEPRWFQVISIHINGFTTSKQLIVTIRDSYGYSQVSVLSLTGTGWYYVYPDFYEISNVKEVEFAPDTDVLGFISLSEVWFEEV